MTTGYLTKEQRQDWITNRIATLEDMLDETSVFWGDPKLIEELNMRRRHKRMLEDTGQWAPNIDLL